MSTNGESAVPPPSTSKDFALLYVRQGWPVFPVHHMNGQRCSCGNRDCKNPGKHPATKNGLKDARLDPIWTGNFWQYQPNINIGIRTGSRAGIAVIDIDPRHGGNESLAALEAEHGPLPDTVESLTGGGGRHFFYKYPERASVRNRTNIRPGIDLRGDGGYVVAPPSSHASGRRYTWREGHGPHERRPAPMPLWLYDLIFANTRFVRFESSRPTNGNGVDLLTRARKYAEAVPGVTEGDRNTAAFKLAGHLAALDVDGLQLDGSQITSLMRSWNLNNTPPLDDSELVQAARSAMVNGTPRAHKPAKRRKPRAGPSPGNTEDRPEYLINPDEHLVVAEAARAITEEPGVYQRAGHLVRIVHVPSASPGEAIRNCQLVPVIALMHESEVRTILAKRRIWQQDKDGQKVWVHPPLWLVRAVCELGEWPGIPHLAGISDTPILRPGGTIHQEPGYDSQTRMIFQPPNDISIRVPESVSQADACAAARRLLDVVSDFPLAGDEHKAAYLAALLTPLARPAYAGCTPCFLFDASTPGSGKMLLANTIGYIVTARELPVMGYADSEELGKRITSLVLVGTSLVLIDNIVGPFGNDALDRALTTTLWQDRILGKSEMVQLPLFIVWYATGNNVQVAADTVRRILPIRLDVMDEHPENRGGFRHPDLLSWIDAERPHLLADAFSILVGYFQAGRPRAGLRPLGSFEGWSALVREAVVWCGLPDPCATIDKLREQADTVGEMGAALLDSWETVFGYQQRVTVSDLRNEVYPMGGEAMGEAAILRSSVETLCGVRAKSEATPRQIGNHLKSLRRRVFGGRYLDSVGKGNRGTMWQLFPVERDDGDSGDSGDSVSPQLCADGRTHEKSDKAKTESPESLESPAPATQPVPEPENEAGQTNHLAPTEDNHSGEPAAADIRANNGDGTTLEGDVWQP